MATFTVRWKSSATATEKQVEYGQYAPAEAYFIGLLSQVDRSAGGWAELWEGDRLLHRIPE
jgi:hypothetical protein